MSEFKIGQYVEVIGDNDKSIGEAFNYDTQEFFKIGDRSFITDIDYSYDTAALGNGIGNWIQFKNIKPIE